MTTFHGVAIVSVEQRRGVMSNFEIFTSKAAELYEAGPSFWNWCALGLPTIIGTLMWFSWRYGKNSRDDEVAGLRERIDGYKERVEFVKHQEQVARNAATKLEAELKTLENQTTHASVRQLQDSTAIIQGSLSQILSASTTTPETLIAPGRALGSYRSIHSAKALSEALSEEQAARGTSISHD
jgi:hypothetical protein